MPENGLMLCSSGIYVCFSSGRPRYGVTGQGHLSLKMLNVLHSLSVSWALQTGLLGEI